IPFWSMIPAITKPGKEREQLSSLARSSSGIGDALPTVLTMVIVPVLSGTTAIAGYRLGFKYWALIIAVVFVISEIVFCLNVPEKKPEDMKTVGIGHMFKSLFKNDQAMTVIGAIILVYLALDIVGNLILYFFQYDVGNTNVYSIFTAVAFLAQVIFMLLIPALRRKIPKLRLFAVGILVQIIGFLILLGFSFTGLYQATSWAILCLPGMMVYAGYGVLNVMLTVFLSDSVDYGQLKNGTREEAVIFSMQTFTVKLASGIAVFFSGLVVDMLHLSSEASASDIAATSADTLSKLRLVMTVPPIIILIAAFIIFKRFYKLNDERMKEISEQIHGDAAEIADDTAEGGEDR
ncbi:MAG: MFS transporter, partial [Lachnospiraceae bacterium]|nr:MFS transporter [Lachnospiraceae bacterium]